MTIPKTKSSTYFLRKVAKFDAKSKFLIVVLIFVAGCVINFKNPTPKTMGIIHVDTHYLYPGRNEFSTSEKFYKKEVAPGRFAQTTVDLDPGQQLLVLNKAIVLHFYDMPDTFYHSGHSTAGAPQFLRIWADTLDKTVHWFGSTDNLKPAGDNLKELVEYVDSIVKSTEAYQGLPSN